MTNNERTTCLVVGGGPAGMVLGLLLARAGVEVTVLEKHADFLRDFRGDTVHASTLTLLDELGLGERFAALPQRRLDRAQRAARRRQPSRSATCSRLPGAHQHIALVPQWDLLDLLADAAAAEPTFTLRRNAEVTDLLRDGGRVVGRRGYTDRTGGSARAARRPHGGLRRARLGGARGGRAAAARVRGADGRLVVPAAAPRRTTRRAASARFSARRSSCVMIDRGGLLAVRLPDQQGQRRGAAGGGDRGVPARGSPALLPWMADRVGELASWDDVQAARRAAGSAAALVRRRAAADRRRGARDVAGRRGRHQPGGAGRGRRRPDAGSGAARRAARVPRRCCAGCSCGAGGRRR